MVLLEDQEVELDAIRVQAAVERQAHQGRVLMADLLHLQEGPEVVVALAVLAAALPATLFQEMAAPAVNH
jgi:hypothetical protein